MDGTEYFNISDPALAGELREALGGSFRISEEKPLEVKETYYDTFDHRLHKAGLLLSKEGGRLVLRNDGTGKPLAVLTLKAGPPPRFGKDFPEGRMREKLGKVMDVRALLPVITINRSTVPYNVLNEDDKTVARLRFIELRPDGENTAGTESLLVGLEPVRGYGEAAQSVRGIIEGLGPETARGGLLPAALRAAGRAVPDYSTKTKVTLEPGMPAHEALNKIFSSLLETIRLNEWGILEDVDTEFLHDFRVSVRRTRSALTLTGGVMPDEARERFKNSFRSLGKMTNRLRDLDIYLLGRDEYLDMAPPGLRPGVERLFEVIVRDREEARKGFTRYMKSDEYRGILDSWEGFLTSGEFRAPSPKADRPVIKLARKQIRKRYSRVISFGSAIHDGSLDEDLHTLRIECKKLRYYIEFFESLFPETGAKQALRQLKALQDNLGEFNDYRVQQESIKGFVSEVPAGSEGERDITAAAGGLIFRLHGMQKERRAEFSERFAAFSGEDTASLFDNLLSGD